MSLRRVAAVLSLSALLFGAYLAHTMGRTTKSEKEERRHHLLPVFRHEELTRISLETRKPSRLLLTHREGDDLHAYFLGENSEELAEPAKIGEFLGALEFATFRREIGEAPPNDTVFGLSEPSLRLTLNFGNERTRVEIGNPLPADPEGLYAKVTLDGESPRYGVVTKKFVDSLPTEPSAYRSPEFLSFSEKEVRSLRLTGPGRKEVELHRDGLGFRVASTKRRAARSALDGLFAEGARLRPQILFPSEKASPEDGSQARLEISLKDGTKVVLGLGAPCPEHPELLLLERSEPAPLRGCASAASIRRLLSHFEHPEETNAIGLHADEIDHVTLETAGEALDLLREDAHFELLGDSPRKISGALGEKFLEELARLNGQLLPIESAGNGRKLGTLKVKGHSPYAEDTAELTFEWWKNSEGYLFRRNDDGAQLQLSADAAEILSANPARFQSRELWRIEPSHLVQLTRTFAKETETVTFRDGAPTLENQPIAEVDGELSGKLLDSLRAPSALGIMADLSKESLLLPTVVLSFTITDESTPRVVRLYRQGNGTCVALTPEGVRPYLLQRDLCALWETRIASRSAFSLTSPDFTRISLRAGTETLVLEREGSGFVARSGPRTARLAFQPDELLEFRAEKLLHFGEPSPREELSAPVLRLFVESETDAPFELSFGALVLENGRAFRYARSSRVAATFLVPITLIEPWRELLR